MSSREASLTLWHNDSSLVPRKTSCCRAREPLCPGTSSHPAWPAGCTPGPATPRRLSKHLREKVSPAPTPGRFPEAFRQPGVMRERPQGQPKVNCLAAGGWRLAVGGSWLFPQLWSWIGPAWLLQDDHPAGAFLGDTVDLRQLEGVRYPAPRQVKSPAAGVSCRGRVVPRPFSAADVSGRGASPVRPVRGAT